jgi:hypothetical protein
MTPIALWIGLGFVIGFVIGIVTAIFALIAIGGGALDKECRNG